MQVGLTLVVEVHLLHQAVDQAQVEALTQDYQQSHHLQVVAVVQVQDQEALEPEFLNGVYAHQTVHAQ